MKILIIGGSRFMGPRIIELLLKNGHNVTVFNRGDHGLPPEPAKFVRGDRDTGFIGVSGYFDTVIDTCAYNKKHIQGVLNDLSFDFYLFVSTAAVYKEPEKFPLSEEMPIGSWSYWGDYNKGKVEAEEILLKKGGKYAIIRPVYILGAGNHVPRESFIYGKIKNGEPIFLPGDGQAKIQFVFVQDVADAVARLAESKTEGVFNCAGDNAVTLRELVEKMAKISGKKAEIKFNPAADGINHNEEEFPFPNINFYCSNEKIKKLGVSFTPLDAGLKADYENYYEKVE